MSARYKPGDRVRVADRPVRGHVRTPRYVRGKSGTVERICGEFRNPEELAYGRWEGPLCALYRIRFAQRELWPSYAGTADDSVDVELFEHWLEETNA